MPRIAAALAVLGTVAFCIGFNTVRYPAVWETLKQGGGNRNADVGEPTSHVPPTTDEPDAKPVAGSDPRPSLVGQAFLPATVGQAFLPAAAAQPKEPDPEPAFCTADGVCHIAAAPTATRDQKIVTGAGVSPALSRGGQTPAASRGADTSATSRAGQIPATSSAGETPAPLPREPPKSVASLTPGKRPLEPVPDDPLPGVSSDASHVASGTGMVPVAGGTGVSPVPNGSTGKTPVPPIAGQVAPAGNAGVRPLPAVDESVAASRAPMPPPGNHSSLFYPTTGYPGLGLSQ